LFELFELLRVNMRDLPNIPNELHHSQLLEILCSRQRSIRFRRKKSDHTMFSFDNAQAIGIDDRGERGGAAQDGQGVRRALERVEIDSQPKEDEVGQGGIATVGPCCASRDS
jgi:hypothetical protein